MAKNMSARIEQVRLEHRSALYRWLYEHHDELAPMLDGVRAPWAATAETFARSRGGKVVTRQAVRKAWPLVKAAKKRSGRAPVRARVENFDPKRDAPAEALRPSDDDDEFQFTDLSGKQMKP